MPNSADSPRDRRRSETTLALIRVARRFTAEFGLAGFTIEQVCSEAAVSRRTFFNYFASKEDAVLGLPIERADAAAVAAFLEGRATTQGDVSPDLLADLATLTEARWRAMDIAPETFQELLAAVEREPRLVARMLEHGVAEERFDARLIEQREGLPPGDLRARVAASIIGAIARASAGDFLDPENTRSFSEIFHSNVAAARQLFASQTTPIGTR